MRGSKQALVVAGMLDAARRILEVFGYEVSGDTTCEGLDRISVTLLPLSHTVYEYDIDEIGRNGDLEPCIKTRRLDDHTVVTFLAPTGGQVVPCVRVARVGDVVTYALLPADRTDGEAKPCMRVIHDHATDNTVVALNDATEPIVVRSPNGTRYEIDADGALVPIGR